MITLSAAQERTGLQLHFAPIGLNWAGVPLRSFETVTRYIAATTGLTGLRVRAVFEPGGNEPGERVSEEDCCTFACA